MSNSYLHNYQADLDMASVSYGKSRMSFSNMINNFNLSRLPDYDNAAELYIPHIIMSRPSLCLSDNNVEQLRLLGMTSAFVNDPYGYDLFKSLSDKSSSMYLPIITTRAMSYSVNDMTLKTIEKGNTFYGHVIKYGKHSEDHKVSSSLSIDFRNDRFLSILKMMYLWECYIYLVSKTDAIEPTIENQKNGIIDYGASIYYLVTRRDDSELVYWEKIVGAFPTSVPFNIFSSSDSFILEERIPIEFAYGIKSDPCDPSVLMDLNVLSGYSASEMQSKTSKGLSSTEIVRPRKSIDPFTTHDSFAKSPFIHISSHGGTKTGNVKYYLQWKRS